MVRSVGEAPQVPIMVEMQDMGNIGDGNPAPVREKLTGAAKEWRQIKENFENMRIAGKYTGKGIGYLLAIPFTVLYRPLKWIVSGFDSTKELKQIGTSFRNCAKVGKVFGKSLFVGVLGLPVVGGYRALKWGFKGFVAGGALLFPSLHEAVNRPSKVEPDLF